MRVVIEQDYDGMSRAAAQLIADLVRSKPNCILGLATGSTPEGMYTELAKMSREGLDFSGVTTFNLDEYYGLGPDHDQSYRYFMEDKFFTQLQMRPSITNVPDGQAACVETHCREYEQAIVDAGGLDIQVLGIGGDGHVAFNEPGSSLGSRTRMVALTEETIDDNSRFFESAADVPRFALTMGVGTILEARQCLLMASSAKKATVVAKAIEGPITSMITASALQLHPNTIAFLDNDAASALSQREYYEHSEKMHREQNAEASTSAAGA